LRPYDEKTGLWAYKRQEQAPAPTLCRDLRGLSRGKKKGQGVVALPQIDAT